MKIKLENGSILELKDGQYISEDGETMLSLDEAEQAILDGKVEIVTEDDEDDDEDEKEKSSDEQNDGEDDEDDEDDDDEDDEDDDEQNETIKPSVSFENINIQEDIQDMFGDAEFGDDFKKKAEVVYDAAVKSTINAHISKLEETHKIEAELYIKEQEERFEVSVKEGIDEMTVNLNSYLDYIAEEWMTENKLAVENGIKSELTESFITGLKDLFTEAYVDIPDDKRDLVAEQADKITKLEGSLNEELNRKVAMKAELHEANRKAVFDKATDGLTETEKAKLEALSTDLTYETNEDYSDKLNILIEKHFNQVDESDDSDTPAVEPETSDNEASYDDSISAYMSAITKSSI